MKVSEINLRQRAGEENTGLKLTGLGLAALSLILSCCMTWEGISPQALRTLGVLAATLFLQIFETFDLCVSCLLSSALLFMFGCVENISEAFSGYTNHVVYFTIASFGVSLAFQKSVLSKKLVSLLIHSKKMGIRRITFIFMACAAGMSSIMSNVAAVVIFIPYVEMFLGHFEREQDRKKAGRCMMISLVVAAMIGGMITPAGSSMNLIAIDLLEKYGGRTIRFIDWVKMGLPLAAVMVVVAFFIITLIYPPPEPTEQELKGYLEEISKERPVSAKDIYIGVLISVIVFVWILSSWVPQINITAISLVGMALMFLPKFPVMTWQEFSKTNSWPAFFVAGNHITLATVAINTGLCEYFTKVLFPAGSGQSEIVLCAQIAAITFLFMAIIPSAPAVVTILTPIIIQFAVSGGWNPVMALMASVLCVPNIYLFPLDAPLVVAYDKKAFTMFDLPKATIWIQMAMIGIVAVWVPFIYKFIS